MRRMAEMLAQLPKDERIILTGHNFHMSKDSASLRGPGAMWTSIGARLHTVLPGEVYGIWLMYDHGEHGNSLGRRPTRRIESDPRRVESLFAKVGDAFILPLHTGDREERYLDEPRGIVQNGRSGRAIVTSNTDAIVFLRKVTPTRRRA